MKNTRLALLAMVLSALLTGCAAAPDRQAAAPTFADARSAYLARDYQRALPLMQSAAEEGHAQAQYALGYMLYNGLGTEPDTEAAMSWIRRSAEQGYPRAVEALGELATIGARQRGEAAAKEAEAD